MEKLTERELFLIGRALSDVVNNHRNNGDDIYAQEVYDINIKIAKLRDDIELDNELGPLPSLSDTLNLVREQQIDNNEPRDEWQLHTESGGC